MEAGAEKCELKVEQGIQSRRTCFKTAARSDSDKVSGGGESFDIDGYQGGTILEAKHVGKANDSPYIPGSSCPEPVRRKILAKAREELRKVRTIIESGSTPFKSLEVITNSPEAKRLFETMLKESRVPGIVRLEP